MEVEITSKYENKLLGRTEVRFKATHVGGKTPSRDEVRDALAGKLGAKKDALIIDELNTTFGKAETGGYAKLYASVDAAKKLEPHHLQLRNKLPGVEKKTKVAVEKKAPAKKGA